MSILKLVVPLVVFFYILSRYKRNSLNLCAFPLMFYLGKNIYLNTEFMSYYFAGLKISSADIVLICLSLCYMYLRNNASTKPYRPSKSVYAAIVIYGIYILFQVGYTYLLFEDVPETDIIFAVKDYLLLPASYILWVSIFRLFSHSQILDFLHTIAFCTLIAAPLYILSGLGLPIYPYEKYLVYSSGLVRDFLTLPKYIILAIAYYLVCRRHNISWMVIMAILIICALFSFTRWVTGTALIVLVLLMIDSIIHESSLISKLKLPVLAIFMLLVGYLGLSLVSPGALSHFSDRWGEVINKGAKTSNLLVRQEYLLTGYRTLTTNLDLNPLFGRGLLKLEQDSYRTVYEGRFDSMVGRQLMILGIVGIICIFSIILFATLRALRFSIFSGEFNPLALIALMIMVEVIVAPFFSPGIMWMAPARIMPIALVQVIARPKKDGA